MRINSENERELHNQYEEYQQNSISKTGKKKLKKITVKLVAAAAAVAAVVAIGQLNVRCALTDIGYTTAEVKAHLYNLDEDGTEADASLEEEVVTYTLKTDGSVVASGKLTQKDTLLSFDSLKAKTSYLLEIFSTVEAKVSSLGRFSFTTLGYKSSSVPASLNGVLDDGFIPPPAEPIEDTPDSPPPPSEELVEPEPPAPPPPAPAPVSTAPSASSTLYFSSDGIAFNVSVLPNDGTVDSVFAMFNGVEIGLEQISDNNYEGWLPSDRFVLGTNTATAFINYSLDGTAGSFSTSQSFDTFTVLGSEFDVNSDGALVGSVNFSAPVEPLDVTISQGGNTVTIDGAMDGMSLYIFDDNSGLGYDRTSAVNITVRVEWIPPESFGGGTEFSFSFQTIPTT